MVSHEQLAFISVCIFFKWDDRAKVFTVKVGLVMRYESLSFDLRTEVFS